MVVAAVEEVVWYAIVGTTLKLGWVIFSETH